MTENQKRGGRDLTAVVILGTVLPVYGVFLWSGKPEIGRAASVCLGMFLVAIRIRWDLKGCSWFWAAVVSLLVLHLPLLVYVPWPGGRIPGVGLLPFGLADCLIILGVIRLLEGFIKKSAHRGDEV